MKRTQKAIASLAAGAALISANVAAAQSECITEREVAHMMIYVTPLAIDAAKSKCSGTLASDGYLLSKSGTLRSKYAALQGETWPLAKNAVIKLAQSGGQAPEMAMVLGLPDDALRPFADAMITQKLSEEIKTKNCANMERGMRLIAPFSPRDTGALIGFMSSLFDLKGPTVCKAD